MTTITFVLLASIIQLLLFCLIPFCFYLISNKTYKGFFRATGLFAASPKSISLAMLAGILFAAIGITLTFFEPAIKAAATGKGTVQAEIINIRSIPIKIIVILITALVKTSLAEEIFFRGFIAKKLITRMGFPNGNLMQAVIFGILHVLLFFSFSNAGLSFLCFAFVLPAIGAYLAGYLNEKKANGSILPGWALHGLSNCLSYLLLTVLK